MGLDGLVKYMKWIREVKRRLILEMVNVQKTKMQKVMVKWKYETDKMFMIVRAVEKAKKCSVFFDLLNRNVKSNVFRMFLSDEQNKLKSMFLKKML